MKVLIVTPLYPPEIGGPATYTAALMARLPACGFSLTLLPFSRVRSYPKFLGRLIFTYQIWQAGKKVDLIYAQDPVSVGFPVFLAARLLRKKFILRVPGDHAWEQGIQRTSLKLLLDDYLLATNLPWLVKILKKAQTKVATEAVGIVVPSLYLKEVVKAWGIPEEKITVVYNSFEKVESAEDKGMAKDRLGLKEPMLVSSGRLVPWKGFGTVIRVFKTLRPKYPGLKLYICGDGPDRNRLEREVAALGLVGEVRFLGQLSRFELFAYIRNATVFVLNTGYEGLSHQLLEVMSLGVPIVTTKIGGNPELIDDKKSGLLVPYNDEGALEKAVATLLGSESQRQKLKEAAIKKAASFTEDKMINDTAKFIRLYENP